MGFFESTFVFGSNANILASSAILGLFIIFIARWLRAPQIPLANDYQWDFFRKKAHAEFMADARTVIGRGIKKVCFDQTRNTCKADILIGCLNSSTGRSVYSPLWAQGLFCQRNSMIG